MKRLAMLEEQKKVVEDSIEEEKEKSPVFTKDQFCMALYNFRKIDVNTQEGKRKLIDTFVNSIFLYDDRLKIVFNGGAKNEEISLSELESSYSIQAGHPFGTEQQIYARAQGAARHVKGRLCRKERCV